MIHLFKKIKSSNLKTRTYQLNKGMTYIELIVVLSIFAVMSSIVIFDYGKFQTKVEIKNLANDIALKIVQAQKEAESGKLSSNGAFTLAPYFQPSYGVYLDLATDNKSFIYFADLNGNHLCVDTNCTGEYLERISITKGNSISQLKVYYQDASTATVSNLAFTFTRPSLTAVFASTGAILGGPANPVSYIEITVTSPQSALATALIKVFASGRIQIN